MKASLELSENLRTRKFGVGDRRRGGGSGRPLEGRLDPVVLRLVGRKRMERRPRPANEFLATGYAMPVADRDGVAFMGSREDTPQTKVLEDLDTGFLVRVERSNWTAQTIYASGT